MPSNCFIVPSASPGSGRTLERYCPPKWYLYIAGIRLSLLCQASVPFKHLPAETDHVYVFLPWEIHGVSLFVVYRVAEQTVGRPIHVRLWCFCSDGGGEHSPRRDEGIGLPSPHVPVDGHISTDGSKEKLPMVLTSRRSSRAHIGPRL